MKIGFYPNKMSDLFSLETGLTIINMIHLFEKKKENLSTLIIYPNELACLGKGTKDQLLKSGNAVIRDA